MDNFAVGLDFAELGLPVFDRWDLTLHEQRPMMGVEIKMLDYDRGVVRLGFAAPQDIVIHREEVWRRNGATSAAPSPSSTGVAAARSASASGSRGAQAAATNSKPATA